MCGFSMPFSAMEAYAATKSVANTAKSTGATYKTTGNITTTTTTVYRYDFPESKPNISTSTSTTSDCVTVCVGGCGGGGGGGGGGGDHSRYVDSDGDGYSDKEGDGPGSTGSKGERTGGGGGGSSRVICTYFYHKGELDAATYYADMEYTRHYLKGATVRGYHFWAIPYARAMRQAPGGLLEAIIRPVTIHRARELAHKMGVENSRPDYLGKAFRWTIEPVCTLIGCFVSEGRWEKLYSREEMQAYAMDYMLYRAMTDAHQRKAPALSFHTQAVTQVRATAPMRLFSA